MRSLYPIAECLSSTADSTFDVSFLLLHILEAACDNSVAATWESQIEFLTFSFSLAQPDLLWAFGD